MITEVLRKLMNEHGMSVDDVADASHISSDTIKNLAYPNRVSDPKVSTVLAIAKVFNVSVNYMCGEPFMSPDEVAVIENYRKCGKHGKSRIRLVSRNEAKAAKKEKETDGKRPIPCLVPKKRTAAGFIYNDVNGTENIWTSNPDAYAAIEVTNNAYAPVHCKGDQLLLEDRYPEHGEMAVFVIDGIGFARTYLEENGKYILRCIVGHKEDIVLKRMDEVECVGTCIGVIRA